MCFLVLVFLVGLPATAAPPTVSLVSSVESPVPVGQEVLWVAEIPEEESGNHWFRFRVREPVGDFRTVKDFSPYNSLTWADIGGEGEYEIEVSIRDNETGESVATSRRIVTSSRVVGGVPAVAATSHPLVRIYSAPACPAGSTMSVRFTSPEGDVQRTPPRDCTPDRSMNFYLAGLRPLTEYRAVHTVAGPGGSADGAEITFATEEAAAVFSGRTTTPGDAPEGIMLFSPLNSTPVATDTRGRLVWYYPGYVSKLTRAAPGGLFLGMVEEPLDHAEQVVREFDLAGITVRETNAARINEQLSARGLRTISGFHHEAARLPDGRLLVLAAVEEVMAGVQGPDPVDIIGDMIIVLDQDLQVVWTWDAFDHLDVRRVAILEEVCLDNRGGCPSFYRAGSARDWLHGNSVQLTPDGNLLYSARHQDWVIKIEYSNGQGSGQVLWKLGKDGDFQTDSTDPNPWFSHQHDARFEPDGVTLSLFDNGNTRYYADRSATSRGQVMRVDEVNRTVQFLLSADLGAYSSALGSASRLPNGNYLFGLGILPDRTSLSVEVDPQAQLVYGLKSDTPVYRVFRMRDLYSAP